VRIWCNDERDKRQCLKRAIRASPFPVLHVELPHLSHSTYVTSRGCCRGRTAKRRVCTCFGERQFAILTRIRSSRGNRGALSRTERDFRSLPYSKHERKVVFSNDHRARITARFATRVIDPAYGKGREKTRR